MRVIDRDFVEPSNLQRQTLFDDTDARDALPKAIAAERKLHAINDSVAETTGGFDVNILADTKAPTASVSAGDVHTGGGREYSFDVAYADMDQVPTERLR